MPKIEVGTAYGAPQWSTTRKVRLHIFDPKSVYKIGNIWAQAQSYCGVDLKRRFSVSPESVSCPRCKSERRKIEG